MGVHSGPVSGVIDVTGRANLAGAHRWLIFVSLARPAVGCIDWLGITGLQEQTPITHMATNPRNTQRGALTPLVFFHWMISNST